MTHLLHFSTRVAAFGAACLMALAVNGAVLLGADQMATEGAQNHAATCAQQHVAQGEALTAGAKHGVV